MNVIVENLCRTIAAHASRHWVAAPVILILWSYLRRQARRFERLVARLDAGRPARVRAPSALRRRRPAQPGGPRLPTTFGWLRLLAPETTGYGTQLKALLAEPELAALLAGATQAGRLLRPVLAMLGQTAEELPPPIPRPRPPPRPPLEPAASDPACLTASAPPPLASAISA